MELKKISPEELNQFVASQEHPQFLQSASWNEFNKSLNRQTWKYGVFDNGQIIASASLIEMPLGFKKSYLYCPRGPIVANHINSEQKEESLKLILSKTRDLTIETKQTEEIFFRFEPPQNLPLAELGLGLRGKPSFKKTLVKTKPIQPPDTLILNLLKSTEELLNSFHSKTRYNIKLAEKHGLKIEKLDVTRFDQCWPLFEQTGKRDQFGLHPKTYYQKMLVLPEVELWVAKTTENAIIAANLMVFYGDTVTYLHGASDYNYRQLMAPNLLQWALIQEAKNKNYKYYDFHGIAPENSANHPWAGVTRFKKGFGGESATYAGTYDFIYESGWYKIYQTIRKINRR